MIPGNCLICSLVIWLLYGGKIILSRRPGTRIPHWLVRCRDGRIRHFKVRREFLPGPFAVVLFLGRIETT